LDAQTLGRLVDDQLLRELGQFGHGLHGLTQAFGGAGEVGGFAFGDLSAQGGFAGGSQIGALAGFFRRLRRLGGQLLDHGHGARALGAVVAQGGAAEDAAGPGGRRRDVGRGEVFGDAALLLRVGRVDQPHQQEEGHHGRHEVGVGDFPRAAVVAAGDHLLHLLDEDRAIAHGHGQANLNVVC